MSLSVQGGRDVRVSYVTTRNNGAELVAHVHNYAHAKRALSRRPPSHFLFLAANCFFIRPGVEAFV